MAAPRTVDHALADLAKATNMNFECTLQPCDGRFEARVTVYDDEEMQLMEQDFIVRDHSPAYALASALEDALKTVKGS